MTHKLSKIQAKTRIYRPFIIPEKYVIRVLFVTPCMSLMPPLALPVPPFPTQHHTLLLIKRTHFFPVLSKNSMLHRRQMVFRIIQMKILVRMSQTYSCQRLPMPFNILRTTSHQALMKFLLSWLSMLMSQVQKLSSISVTGFGKQKDGLLIGKIQLSLHFPKKVMSANAKTTEQLH